MLHQDFLMRMILDLVAAMQRSYTRSRGHKDPEGAAAMLELAIGEATDIDGTVLLSLSPSSIASILQVSGTEPQLIEHLSRSLLLVSDYHREAGNEALRKLREEQAYALATAYGIELSPCSISPEELEELFEKTLSE